MPIYEYLCVDCEKLFEQLKPMSQSDAPTPCPTCGRTAERLSPSSFAAFTMRDGYPRRINDNGLPYGPVGPYTTGATPEMKAKAMAAERRERAELNAAQHIEGHYRAAWTEPAKTDTPKAD